MKCPVCSHENEPPGPFCERCGAVMPSAPPSGSAVREAGPDAQPAAPVYLAAPRRHGVAFLLVAAALVIGAGLLVVARFADDAEPARSAREGESVDRGASESASVDLPPPAPRVEPAIAPPPVAPPEPASPSRTIEEPLPAPVPEATLPPKHVPAQPPRTVRPPHPKPKPPPPPPERARSLAPEPAPPRAAAPAAAPPAPPPPVDRWARLREELAACAKEPLLGRIVCEQRVRWRHCEGHWGSVPQCPGARQSDYTP